MPGMPRTHQQFTNACAVHTQNCWDKTAGMAQESEHPEMKASTTRKVCLCSVVAHPPLSQFVLTTTLLHTVWRYGPGAEPLERRSAPGPTGRPALWRGAAQSGQKNRHRRRATAHPTLGRQLAADSSAVSHSLAGGPQEAAPPRPAPCCTTEEETRMICVPVMRLAGLRCV